MPGANDIRAGRAFVEAYLDKTKLNRGLKSIGGDLKRFGAGISAMGKKLLGVGAAIAGPFLLAARSFAKMGDELDKADPARLRELMRRMVSRIDLWFAEEKQGKRTVHPLAKGTIDLRPDPVFSKVVSRGEPSFTLLDTPYADFFKAVIRCAG